MDHLKKKINQERMATHWILILTSRITTRITLLLTLSILIVFPLYVDRPVVQWLSSYRQEVWFFLFQLLQKLGESHLYLIASAIAFLLSFFVCKVCRRSSMFLFFSVAISGIIADIIKIVVGRSRPELFLQSGIYQLNPFHFSVPYSESYIWYSLPSGHATTAISVAIVFSILYPGYRFFWIPLGVLVALSRVVTCAHYPSDVWVGAVIGLFTTLQVRAVISRMRME